MNLKDLFSRGTNGTLTYEQFEALAKESNAKFIDLAEGNYVDKKKYQDDLSVRDTRISTLDTTLKARDTDLATLRQQLETAGTDSAKLTEVTNSFTNLQKQYEKDTNAYAKQLKDQEYQFAVKEYANTKTFTSQAAKRDFVNSMLGKNLQVENGVIIGATDFEVAYAKENADAFVVAKAEEPKKPAPHFVDSTNGSNDNGGQSSKFNFNFTGVRQH